jgi:hypothetical protein
MKRLYLILTAAAALFCCSACSSSNGPEAVAKKAIEALQNKDFDAYAATFDLSSSEQKLLAGIAEEKMDEAFADKGGIKSFKIANTEVDEDEASVTVHIFYKDGSEDDQKMSFVKVGDEWKQKMDK